LHWALGLALAPMLVLHILTGRRSRGLAPGAAAEHRAGGAKTSERAAG